MLAIPTQQLRAILNSGAIIECPVTSTDIATVEKIFEPGAEVQNKVLHMHTDITYIYTLPFLLGGIHAHKSNCHDYAGRIQSQGEC